MELDDEMAILDLFGLIEPFIEERDKEMNEQISLDAINMKKSRDLMGGIVKDNLTIKNMNKETNKKTNKLKEAARQSIIFYVDK